MGGEIKRQIAAGVSRCNQLKAVADSKDIKTPDSYPAKKKAKRPVNLFLSGVMLQWYKATKVSGVRFSLGIAKGAPKDVKERAQANNEGVPNEGSSGNAKDFWKIAPRRFIPIQGRSFNISVMRKIKNLYAQRIETLLSKK